jgi:hypothetical protein
MEGKLFVVADEDQRGEVTCDRRVTGGWLPWLRLVTSIS